MIDFVGTKGAIHDKQILDVKSLTSPNVESDHYLALCKIRFNEGWKERHIQMNEEYKLTI